MSRPSVYLETSFTSYLVSGLQQRRSSDVNTAHRQLSSLRWWVDRDQFELFISEVVSRECATSHPEAVRNRLQILAFASVLPEIQEILELAKRLVEPVGPLPRSADADATHIAFASAYECNIC